VRSLLGLRAEGEAPAAARPIDDVEFPGAEGALPVLPFTIPAAVTVPRHVTADRLGTYLSRDVVEQLAALDPAAVDLVPEFPADGDGTWAIVVGATGRDGRSARGWVTGPHPYRLTAVIAVEAARRLAEPERRGAGELAGALAQSQAFDPAGFLDWLAPHGVRWSVTTAGHY
jgi:hypothetical protein